MLRRSFGRPMTRCGADIGTCSTYRFIAQCVLVMVLSLHLLYFIASLLSLWRHCYHIIVIACSFIGWVTKHWLSDYDLGFVWRSKFDFTFILLCLEIRGHIFLGGTYIISRLF